MGHMCSHPFSSTAYLKHFSFIKIGTSNFLWNLSWKCEWFFEKKIYKCLLRTGWKQLWFRQVLWMKWHYLQVISRFAHYFCLNISKIQENADLKNYIISQYRAKRNVSQSKRINLLQIFEFNGRLNWTLRIFPRFLTLWAIFRPLESR